MTQCMSVTEEPMDRGRYRKRAFLVICLLAAVAGAGIWLLRDWPRRRVARALEERLGAEVGLGSLSIRGSRDFVLHDLTIRRMSGQPRLERLHVETLFVRGTLSDVMDARFETLRAVGVEARLVPPPPSG